MENWSSPKKSHIAGELQSWDCGRCLSGFHFHVLEPWATRCKEDRSSIQQALGTELKPNLEDRYTESRFASAPEWTLPMLQLEAFGELVSVVAPGLGQARQNPGLHMGKAVSWPLPHTAPVFKYSYRFRG